MTEDLGDLGDSTDQNKTGPDHFTFYIQEIQKLLSTDEDCIPYSTSKASKDAGKSSENKKDVIGHLVLNGKENSSTVSGSFSPGVCSKLSDSKKERLKSLLKQIVVSVSQGVDDSVEPVLAIRRMQSQLRSRKSLVSHSTAACEGDVGEQPRKKIKQSSLLSSSSSESEDDDADLLKNEIVNGAKKGCDICHSTETTIQTTGPKGSKSICNHCRLKSKQEKGPLSGDDQNTGSCRVSNIETNTESKEVDEELQFLLENDTASVESSIKKHSDELFMTLDHMEQQLEGLLDLLQSSSRLMTTTEKQQLQSLIQKLPPRNLDRVVEIIQKNKSLGKHFSDAINVDLEKEDNVTLWRLYIYVKAVENARKLAR